MPISTSSITTSINTANINTPSTSNTSGNKKAIISRMCIVIAFLPLTFIDPTPVKIYVSRIRTMYTINQIYHALS